MRSTARRLRKVSFPGEDRYTSSSGASGLGEGGVISLLNMERSPGVRRVAELVEAFRRAARLMESINASSGSGREQPIAVNALEEINTRLSKFQWLPAIFGVPQPEPHFKVHYLMFIGKSNDAALALEHYAVQWIVDHVDEVHRLRRCHMKECRKWFFAKTDHQKYCSKPATCRQKDAAKGEAFKERRRLYMKVYRREEAERDARAKRLAKGKRK